MAPASLYAHARSQRWRMIRLLSSVALMPSAIVTAYAQTIAPAPAQSSGAQPASETRSMDGTTVMGPMPNGGVAAPTLRLSGLRYTASADLTETYTTNALGVPQASVANYSGSDFLTRATLSLGLHDHTPRLDTDLAYSLSGLLYANHPSYNQLFNYLTALTRAVLIPNRLLLTGSAFAEPVLINSLGPQAAAAPNSGLRDTYGYTVSPDLTFRFGQFARSETLLTQSSVFFVQPAGPTINLTVPGAPTVPDQLVSYGATQRISSGQDFYRLNWILSGTVNKTTQPGLVYTDTSGTGNFRYAVIRSIIVTGLFGYETLTSNQSLTHPISGPTAMAGLQLSPTRDLQVNASAGRQFNSPSYQGDLHYQVGAFTSLVGALTDSVTAPASRLTGNLANLGVNGAGDFINTNFQVNPAAPPSPVSGVSAFNPAPIDGTAITTGIVRYRTGNLSLVHIADRTQYRLTAFHTAYDTLTPLPSGISPKGTSTGLDLTISRTFTPRLTGSIGSSISTVNDLGNKFSLYQGNLSLNYQMSASMQAYFLAGYEHRGSGATLAALSALSGDYSEAHITISLRRQFY
jgi:uncharacterized protein (PEP-CTERM system associated)